MVKFIAVNNSYIFDDEIKNKLDQRNTSTSHIFFENIFEDLKIELQIGEQI